MAQKPAASQTRKTQAAKKPAAKTPATKPVKKTSGAQAAQADNLDALVNKHLAAFRSADQALAQDKALAQTCRERYPELAAYLPEATPEEGALELREDAAEASAGVHTFRIRLTGRAPRYELKGPGEDEYQGLEAAAWLQAFKDHLALRIAKVILAREAAQGSH